MKRVIRASNNVAKRYYHYDDRVFKVGDSITKSYTLPEDVVNCYKEIAGVKDANHIVYLLDAENEDYHDTYLHAYQVSSDSEVLERFMDYSPMICDIEVTNWIKNGKVAEKFRTNIYETFAEAYSGSKQAMEDLQTLFNYTVSYKIEYIAESVKVVKVIK